MKSCPAFCSDLFNRLAYGRIITGKFGLFCRYKNPHIAVNRMKDILAQSELAGSKTRLAMSAMLLTS